MERAFHTETRIHQGRELKVEHFADDDHGPPWENDCGRGIVENGRDVSSKRPGECILHRDQNSAAMFDWQATMKKARKDGWGLSDKDMAALTKKLKRTPTKVQIAHAAVEREFQLLRGWCNDDWFYMGVVVTDVETDVCESLWGIESCCEDYVAEIEKELCEQVYMPAVTALVMGRVA